MLHIRKRGIKTNLAALGKEFEIKHNPDKLHDALVDLELNIKVWNKLKWMIEV
jgi:DNA polymerase III epsilon subunit-like protein